MTASVADERARRTDVRPCKGRDCERMVPMDASWLCGDCDLARRISRVEREQQQVRSLLKDRLERMRR